MMFSLWEKKSQQLHIIEAKSEAKAFDIACKRFGVNGFSGFERHYEGSQENDYKMSFLKRAISNVEKYLYKQRRRGLH